MNIKALKTIEYARSEIEKGYSNQYLVIDLTTATITIGSIPKAVKDVFIGGKGFDLWLLWHAVYGETKWNDA
jgi:aldehyde:ferredoxin oxidoreductase